MNLFDALGAPIRASFSSHRSAVPEHLFYGQDALGCLAASLPHHTPLRRVAVFFDVRTRAVAGVASIAALEGEGWSVSECLIPDPPKGGSPVCDESMNQLMHRSTPEVDAYVAVGSGVVNDLTKWLAADNNVPYAVVATAASMNGYSAANVAPTVKGVKSLIRARAPRIIAADPRVLEQAPFALTASGLGDLIAKPVSTADWHLNHRLFGEAFSPAIAGIVDGLEPSYLQRPSAIAQRDPSAIKALFEALVFSGCAMTLHGSSLPASGGEHLISHTLDMMAQLEGVEHDLHGRQVGVATIFTAALYQRIVQMKRPRWIAEDPPFDSAIWGPIAPAVQPEHAKKCEAIQRACEHLIHEANWDALREELVGHFRDPAAIRACLKEAGAAHSLADIRCSRERFLVAVHHGGAMRGRFTSLDLARACGVLPDAAEEIVDEWLV